MRLIDADALKEKFKEHYDLFVGDYKGEHMSVADKLRVDEILNSMAEVINAPTIFNTDNATNGDVIKAIFGYKRISHFNDNPPLVDVYGLDNNDDTDSVTFYEDWWNALYKKGGKTEC